MAPSSHILLAMEATLLILGPACTQINQGGHSAMIDHGNASTLCWHDVLEAHWRYGERKENLLVGDELVIAKLVGFRSLRQILLEIHQHS